MKTDPQRQRLGVAVEKLRLLLTRRSAISEWQYRLLFFFMLSCIRTICTLIVTIARVIIILLTLQLRAVPVATYQWTQSATESLTNNGRGSVQVTTVCLVVDRWLFSPTLDVRRGTVNWLSGWVQTSRIGSGLWDHGGKPLTNVTSDW